jgi:hypothetical protein
MKQFEIPITLFIFKRTIKSVQVLNRIREVRPRKLYIIADAGRDSEEQQEVDLCRKEVENNIDWPCEVIKNYAKENVGVYDRIGLGSKWVLEREESAIFLEDDNLPDISFFRFCEELLNKYKENEKILWICGTNYLEKYQTKDNSDYVFTQHMLPCGWASWQHKFSKYYDGELELYTEKNIEFIRSKYDDQKFFEYDLSRWQSEIDNKIAGKKYNSWDYQMAFSIRIHDLYGIVPKYNLIKNIGVDNYSIHGGTSINSLMTKRFCGIESYPLTFPLKHPSKISVDELFERKTKKIIMPPPSSKFTKFISSIIRKIFKIPSDTSLRVLLKIEK